MPELIKPMEMQVNSLYDVYASLKVNFGNECNLVLMEPTSYIRTLSGSNDKIIFIFKQIQPIKIKIAPSIDITDLNNTVMSRHDLTGNPLEDDCVFDTISMDTLNLKTIVRKAWTDQEESYSYIDCSLARKILQKAFMEKQCNSGYIWTLCSGLDDEKTLLIGTELKQKWFSRGIVYFTGTFYYSEITMNNLLDKHRAYLPKKLIKIDTEIESFFQIDTNSTLKLSWNSSASNPSLQSYKRADVVLYQTIKIGDADSPAEEFWRQLIIVEMIRNSIMQYTMNIKTELEYESGSGVQLTTIEEKIRKILTDIVSFTMIDNNVSSDIESVIERARTRNFVDMTDQLWTILRFCNSYQDLKAAFDFIFASAVNYNIVNIPTNKNRLAVLIREISQERIAIPCLTGTEPLELLLEIGLEKLAKDYEFIFTENKLCCASELHINTKELTHKTTQTTLVNVRKTLHNAAAGNMEHQQSRKTLMQRNEIEQAPAVKLIGFQNSVFNAMEVEEKLNKLCQIHLILEHILLMRNNLNLENVYQSAIDQLKEPSMPFNRIKFMSYDKREFQLLNEQIFQRIENCEPHAQRIVLKSENKDTKIQNTFYYSINSILPTNIFPFMQADDMDKAALKKDLYYGLHYLKIESHIH